MELGREEENRSTLINKKILGLANVQHCSCLVEDHPQQDLIILSILWRAAYLCEREALQPVMFSGEGRMEK